MKQNRKTIIGMNETQGQCFRKVSEIDKPLVRETMEERGKEEGRLPPNATVGTDCSRKPDEVSVGGQQQGAPGSAPGPLPGPTGTQGRGRGPLSSHHHLLPSSQALVRGSSRDSPVTTGPRVSVHGGPADPRQSHMPTIQRFPVTSLSLC